MSLNLNARQRAMLAEMDVHVWGPLSTDDAVPERQPTDFAAVNTPISAPQNVAYDAYVASAGGQNRTNSMAASVATGGRPLNPALTQNTGVAARQLPVDPGAVQRLPEEIAVLDWPGLHAAVAACQACVMGMGRRAPVLSALPATAERLPADWLVLGEPPDDAQEHAGQPFVGDAGRLLDNMLKAVGVQRYQPTALADAAHSAYLSLVLKCRPALPTAPDRQAVAQCAHYVRREIALVQPKVILAMGRIAMHLLLSQDHPQGLKLPLGKLRGQVWHYQGVPVVVTYPPDYLLRNGQDKGRAWADLCLAQQLAQGLKS